MFGYSICVLNSCLELLAVDLRWCDNDWQGGCAESRLRQGIVTASLYLGAAVGSWILGWPALSAWTSRSQLLLSDALFISGALFGASAQSATILVLARFLSGVGLGVCGIATPVFIAEISPRDLRGLFCCSHGTVIAIGAFAAVAMGLPQAPPPVDANQPLEGMDIWYWRWLLGSVVAPAAFQAAVFGFFWPIDPPGQLVGRGQVREARALIFSTHGLEPPDKNAGPDFLFGPRLARTLEMEIGKLIRAAAEAKSIEPIRMADAVFDPFFRCALWLGFFLAALSQLCGVNALMSYSNILFRQGGIAPDQVTRASTIMCVVNVLVSYLASRAADRYGRRSLLLAGTTLMAFALFLLSLCSGRHASGEYLGVATVFCFTLFVVSFNTGLGGITWLYLSEIYPIEIRGAALSTCGIITWIGGFAVVFGARFLTLHESVRVFGLVTTLGALGIYLWVVETKGCSLDDSPLTPRSERSTSALLSPSGAASSPRAGYNLLGDS